VLDESSRRDQLPVINKVIVHGQCAPSLDHHHRLFEAMPATGKDAMGYVYSEVDDLARRAPPLVGRGECVDLIKEFVPRLKGKSTATWRAGVWVMEAGSSIRKGTAIATFDKDGRFPQNHSGQHAALVVSVTPLGIWVVDQWRTKARITKRLIRVPPQGQERNPDGSFSNRSNNALAFQVIE
jgi:copper chaperone CopZ